MKDWKDLNWPGALSLSYSRLSICNPRLAQAPPMFYLGRSPLGANSRCNWHSKHRFMQHVASLPEIIGLCCQCQLCNLQQTGWKHKGTLRGHHWNLAESSIYSWSLWTESALQLESVDWEWSIGNSPGWKQYLLDPDSWRSETRTRQLTHKMGCASSE